MTDAEQLYLQHVLAALAQGLGALAWLQREGDTVAVPREWVDQWLREARQGLCLLRRQR